MKGFRKRKSNIAYFHLRVFLSLFCLFVFVTNVVENQGENNSYQHHGPGGNGEKETVLCDEGMWVANLNDGY